MSDPDELRRQAEAIRWYHTLDLGHGVVTAGINDPAVGVARLRLPAALEGRTVLDIGAWDGAYSFGAERRGAARVLATEAFSWSGGGWGTKDGFELARSALGSTVDDRTIDVFDLDPATVGTFDLVLFLDVAWAPSLARRLGGLVRHRRRDALQRSRAVFHAWKAP